MRILNIIESSDILNSLIPIYKINNFEYKTVNSNDELEEILNDFLPNLIIFQEDYEFVNFNFLFSILKNNNFFKNSTKIIIKDSKSNLSIKNNIFKNQSIIIIPENKIDEIFISTIHPLIPYNKTISREKSIVYISDNKFMHIVLEDLFKKYNFKILHTYDGDEGIKKALLEQPNLILTDIDVPLKNGIEICKEIKSNHKLKNIPVVIYSSCEITSILNSCRDAGANKIFNKNIELSEFAKEIKKIL